MGLYLAGFLLAGATGGIVALAIIAVLVRRHVVGSPPSPRRNPPEGISILKPLCGFDDDLEANLERFATMDHARFELLLGVKNTGDTAFPVALAAAKRWPDRVRVVVQNGEPGLNPKVNQLVTLARAAKYEILVVSDSNAIAGPGYLQEISALFEDPNVGCVTNPVAGEGEASLGALLDNLHLSSAIGPGQIGAMWSVKQPLVVGKSMALRKSDLAALGGFEAYTSALAEDFVIGRAVRNQLQKDVVIARMPVLNLARHRSVGDFGRRYIRWSVIHRTAVMPTTYASQGLLNPAPLAWLAWLFHPTGTFALAAAFITIAKAAVDVASASTLRGRSFGLVGLAVVPLKDFLIFIAWLNGWFARTVNWRGNRLRVTHGSRLIPPDDFVPLPATFPEPEPVQTPEP
ncbi:MAG: glycosyltransferase [Myxococcaceae bacterium]|nr:glycosyltransferase [Myxococcaceae bacterium]